MQKPADTTPLSRVTMQAIDALHSGYAVFDEYGAEHWAISSKTKELVADTLRDNGPTPSTPVATGALPMAGHLRNCRFAYHPKQ